MSVTIHPQFIVDAQGERQSVVLSIAEFDALLEELENFNDAKRVNELLEHSTAEDFQPWEEVKAELRAAGKIK